MSIAQKERALVTGLLSHIDFCVHEPALAIPFYDTLLTALGYERWRDEGEEWRDPSPSRAAWGKKLVGEYYFGIDLRPTEPSALTTHHDRYGPGPHHLAFHVTKKEDVDRIARLLQSQDARILDAPSEYGGRQGYGKQYYAVFFEDPDGVKLEVVCAPGFGPPV